METAHLQGTRLEKEYEAWRNRTQGFDPTVEQAWIAGWMTYAGIVKREWPKNLNVT